MRKKTLSLDSTEGKIANCLSQGDFDGLLDELLTTPSKSVVEYKVIKEVDKEVERLCSVKGGSLFRTTETRDLKDLTTDTISDELKERTPLFHKFLR